MRWFKRYANGSLINAINCLLYDFVIVRIGVFQFRNFLAGDTDIADENNFLACTVQTFRINLLLMFFHMICQVF